METKMSFFGIFLVLICVGSVNARETPTIGFISPDEEVDIGGEVEMTCQVKNGKEHPVFWMRLPNEEDKNKENASASKGGADGFAAAGGFPISTGPNLLFENKRFSLDHDEALETYTLKIRDIKLTDAAVYRCQVLVGLGDMTTAEVEVRVKREPNMVEKGIPRTVRAAVGEEAVLDCLAKGVPDPNYKWSRGDKRLMYNGRPLVHSKKLTIKEVKKEDRGEYLCTASNGVGNPAERKVLLEVEHKPTIAAKRPRVPQKQGFSAELSCQISAFPAPTIYWRRGNDTVTNSQDFKISHYAHSGDVVTSTLKIEEVKSNQYGNYTCEARNRHGQANMTVELYQAKIAICPPVCGDVDLTSGSHMNFVNLIVLMVVGVMVRL